MNTWPKGKLKTVDEVADFLGVHRNTVLRRVKSGKLACTRISRNSVRFTWDQVADYLKSCEESVIVNFPNLSEGGE
jgi:excisionase family DNA binding protein